MSTLNLNTVELVSTLRAAPENGATNSQDYNDSWTESLADLASLSGFINDILLPMLNGLDATIQTSATSTPSGIEGRYIFGDTSDQTFLFFDALSSEPLTIADSLRILSGLITTVQTTIANLNVEVTALQTALSSTNQNDIAQALQNITATLNNITNQVISNTQVINNPAVFGPSGPAHSVGAVPDPGPVSGMTRYLREDATWDVPPAGGGSGTVVIGTNQVAFGTAPNTIGGSANLSFNPSTSTFEVDGASNLAGISLGITNQTSNYTTAITDYAVIVNSASPVTVTLRTAGIIAGQLYQVKNTNTGVVTVVGQTGNIDGASSFLLATQYSAAIFQWDGVNWWVDNTISTIGGTDTDLQVNSHGVLYGDSNLTWNYVGQALTIAGSAEITTPSISTEALVINGLSGQTASLLEINNNATVGTGGGLVCIHGPATSGGTLGSNKASLHISQASGDSGGAGKGVVWTSEDNTNIFARVYVESGGTGGSFLIEYTDELGSAILSLAGNEVGLNGTLSGFGTTQTGGIQLTTTDNTPVMYFAGTEAGTKIGVLTKYLDYSVAGDGIAVINAVADNTSATGNISSTQLTTVKGYADGPLGTYGGMMRASVYIVPLTSVASSTIVFNLTYTDDYGPQTQSSTSISGSTAGAFFYQIFTIYTVSSTAVSYSTTTTNSPNYSIHVRLEVI